MNTAEEFIEDFLEHAGMTKEERAAYNREYYLKNRNLKGRGRSGDDVRKTVKPSSLPKRDPKEYKELRNRFGSLIRRTKHIMVPLLKNINSPTSTPKEKAEFDALYRKLEPFMKEAMQLERDIKRSGFQAEFDKFDRFMPKPGMSNSSSPRSAR